MKYLIPTIQHTGTKFLAKLFPQHYHWASFQEDTSDKVDVLYLGHLTINSIEAIKRLDCPVLVPLRHPYLVAESWMRRNKPINQLAQNFCLLINEIDNKDPYYLPIDVENKQDYLDKINAGLNLNFSTDWKVENSKKSTYNLTYRDINPPNEIVNLVEDMGDFFKRFY